MNEAEDLRGPDWHFDGRYERTLADIGWHIADVYASRGWLITAFYFAALGIAILASDGSGLLLLVFALLWGIGPAICTGLDAFRASPITLELDASGYRFVFGWRDIRVPWHDVRLVSASRHGVTLWVGNLMGHWFPRRMFADADIASIRAVVAEAKLTGGRETQSGRTPDRVEE